MRARLATLSAVTGLAALSVAIGAPGLASAAGPLRPLLASSATGHATIGGPLLASHGVVVRPLAGAPALPPAAALPASSWMVTDLTTGQVLAAKDAHGKYLPASTLKTLTAVTLLPKLSPTDTFTATFKDATVDGSRVGLVPGISYTISKLFTCMLVVSANDAADALAQANGGIKLTVRQMNAKAHELQADDTRAMTPSGLDGVGETTSAYDLALIAQAGLAMPSFRHYVSIVHSTVPAPHHHHFAIYTHNELLTTYHGDIGVKNGYTVAAMGTDVNAATRHGQTIVVTLMHAYPDFWPMAKSLLNWGFKANGKVLPVGTLVQPLAKVVVNSAVASPQQPPATAAAVLTTTRSKHSFWLTVEVVAASTVALALTAAAMRRRHLRDRRYRTRLKLPRI